MVKCRVIKALRRLRLSREQQGFTIIEVLVAAMLMLMVVVALLGSFDSSRSLVTVSEKNQVISHQGEAEMERILSRKYSAIALTSAPSPSSDPSHPDYYVAAGSPPQYRWDQGSTGPKSAELLIDSAQGQVAHNGTWSDTQSRLSGSVYRYVTAVTDPCCSGSDYARRITVLITVNGRDLKRPLLISSVVPNPNG